MSRGITPASTTGLLDASTPEKVWRLLLSGYELTRCPADYLPVTETCLVASVLLGARRGDNLYILHRGWAPAEGVVSKRTFLALFGEQMIDVDSGNDEDHAVHYRANLYCDYPREFSAMVRHHETLLALDRDGT